MLGRAHAWRASAPLEGAIWVETIPFNETRDYVKKVLANTIHFDCIGYAGTLTGASTDLDGRLVLSDFTCESKEPPCVPTEKDPCPK